MISPDGSLALGDNVVVNDDSSLGLSSERVPYVQPVSAIVSVDDGPLTSGMGSETELGAIVVVMGVAGTGKTTLGRALAGALGVPYVEGDDLHPQANVDKMASGHPLNDADREPWLFTLRHVAEEKVEEARRLAKSEDKERRVGVVVTCSALKRYYRDILRGKGLAQGRKGSIGHSGETRQVEENTVDNGIAQAAGSAAVIPTYFVFIQGDKEVLKDRMEKRQGHFMKVGMLESQLRDLENPAQGGEEGVVAVDLLLSTEEQVKAAKEGLRRYLPDLP